MSDAPAGDPLVRRVLAIAPEADRTGSTPWIRDVLAWARQERGVEVEAVVCRDGPLVDDLRALGPVRVAPTSVATTSSVAHALRRPGWAHVVEDRWLARALAAAGPADVVLAGSPTVAAALRRHGDRAGPVVAHVDGCGVGAATPPGALDAACLVVAATTGAAEWVARPPSRGGLGVSRDRLRLHPGPIAPPSRHARPEADDRALVVGCGPVGWRAGTDLFVAVAALVGPSVAGRAVRFTWIGGTDDDGSGRDASDDVGLRGLGDVVRLSGDQADRADRLAAADVLLVTERDHSYPIAAVEAALAGTPVLGFRPGTALLEAAGREDLRVDRLDVDRLAQQVVDLLTAPDRGRLLAGDLARAAADASTPLAATALWADIERAVAEARPGAGA
ncbi:glycosyltransferase [Iamia majanohamensis]|uniref:Glycosyltransferase n=1 Tax=Iamia majanohamensis TaxID=467976 RepID=A0AAF0BR80_9ACTN|nr:glycosyltransferase [Iamia majanohamensis]WCO66171.1 glycosyltransferase [Iamia majanohamensis]